LVSTAQAQLFKPNHKPTSLTFSTSSWNAGYKVSFTAQWKNTTVTLRNAGAHLTGLCFSTNSIISTGDTLMREGSLSGLKSGYTATWKSSVTVPTINTTNGTKYVGLYVDYKNAVKETSEADSTYRVVEKSETNNSRAIARTVFAPHSSTRALEYVSLLQTSSKPYYMSRSQTLAVGYASVGGSVSMRVTAPALAGGLQLCVWSFKSSWVLDAASNFSLGLTNNPALFPGWFSTLNSKGQATPYFRLPKGSPLSGTLRVYTKSFLFNHTFKLVGSTNVVSTYLYK